MTDSCRVYRGVRYAQAARFTASEFVDEFDPDPERADGPICPQPTSRIEDVIGPAPRSRQDEDCLTLTVTVPGGRPADGRALPVLFWIPGGNFTIGAGSWPMYDATRLSVEGEMIVVSINYRLGPFGFMRAPQGGAANVGITDVLNALAWVQNHIAKVGGDPARVTLAGQSAGAFACWFLLGLPRADHLYSSVLMQSPPLGLRCQDQETADAAARHLVEKLGGADPSGASVPDLLEAAAAIARDRAGRLGVNTGPVFAPALGVDGYPDPAAHAAHRLNRARGLPVLIGTTASEMSAMQHTAALVRGLSRLPVAGSVVAAAVIRRLEALVYVDPVRRLTSELADAGARVYPYVSSVAAPDSPYGPTHCSDIPFVFGDEATWIDTPLLRGWSWGDLERAGRDTRQAWISFVDDGAPASDGLTWKRQEPGAAPLRNTLT